MPVLSSCRVSAEKSDDNHMGIPLYVTCCFPFVAFNIFSLVFNICQFDKYVSWRLPPWVYPGWDSVLLGLECLLSHVREAFGYFFRYFLRTFLFSFWDPFHVNFGALMSERTLKLFSFLFILFSLFCSVAVISTNTNLSSNSLNLLFCLIYSGTDSVKCIFLLFYYIFHFTYCIAQLCIFFFFF